MSLLTMNDLSKSYRTETLETAALDGVSLEIGEGEFVAIMGPSGCGKSTLLNVMGMLDGPTGGSYRFAGQEVAGLRESQLAETRKKYIGFIFQSFNLVDELTVRENVELALLYHNIPAAERKARVEKVLDKVGIAHRAGHRPAQLSGGQQQRVAIARAMAMKPELMLFDEPTSALDPELVGEVLSVLKDLAREGMTMIVVTHEMGFAREVADHIVFIDGGVVVEAGSPDQVIDNPKSDRLRGFIDSVL